jgi:hypothetical protein
MIKTNEPTHIRYHSSNDRKQIKILAQLFIIRTFLLMRNDLDPMINISKST